MIRKATEADVPIIVRMVGHFITAKYADLLTFKPRRLEELTLRVLEIGCILVAEEDGAVVGFVAGCALEDSVSGIPMLDEMGWWVEPGYRHKSVGPRLLQQFENWAKQKNLRLVKMVAPAGSNVGAFYKRLGYTEVETAWIKRL